MSYASIAELKAYDSSVTASDSEIQAALDFATALATARARRTFSVATATAVTVNDVRTRNVVVDLPFSNVTAVAVDGHELPTSSYVVEPWGIRLLSGPRIDFDGYGLSVEPWGTRPFSNPLLDLDGYGSSVTVTAGTVALRRRASPTCLKAGTQAPQAPWRTVTNRAFEGLQN